MSKSIPTVQKFMTCDPVTITALKTVVEAQSLMKEKQIRHLPITEGDKIIGIISDRDVKLAMGLVGADPRTLRVKDIAHGSVYTVHPQTPIDQVADEMAVKQYGCAVVEVNQKIVGIFTTVDALKAISDICHQRYHL